MKHIKKALAFVMTLAMAFAFVAPAFATEGDSDSSSITINRDSTWNSNATSKKATYTYYKIFDADITDAAEVNETTGALTEDGNVVYTISGQNADEKAAALPNIFSAKKAADGKYYITLKNANTTASTIVTALQTLVEENDTLFPAAGEVTSEDNPVVLNVPSDGYYLILASNGMNAAVQTIGNVTINEKNDYPTIDKQQQKADGTWVDTTIPAEIGTTKNFKITVDIPVTANKDTFVYDTMSAGLAYKNDIALKVGENTLDSSKYEILTKGENDTFTWGVKLPATNAGSTIVITYSATVTADCLTDTTRENKATLKYDDDNYVVTDSTNYTTYFGGIEKVDGAQKTNKLKDVEFTLTVNNKAFNVTKAEGADYYIPGGNSNKVVTDANGKIVIRGLDNTNTYTLTEQKTNEGYNLLETPKDLTLVEDKGTAYTTATFDQVLNNKGTQMPSTGGIGTTIFYIVGGVMVAGAAIFLLTKRRMAGSEE